MGKIFLKKKTSRPLCGAVGESSLEVLSLEESFIIIIRGFRPASWDWPAPRAPFPDPPPPLLLWGARMTPPGKPTFPMPKGVVYARPEKPQEVTIAS